MGAANAFWQGAIVATTLIGLLLALRLIARARGLQRIVENQPDCIHIFAVSGRLSHANRAALELMEADPLTQVRAEDWQDMVLPAHRTAYQQLLQRGWQGEMGRLEFEIRTPRGAQRWVESTVTPLRDRHRVTHLLLTTADVSGRRRTANLAASERRVLEMVANNAPVDATLDALLRSIEAHSPELITSVLLLDEDGHCLRHCVAPRLPEDYIKAIDGVKIGPTVGSCGAAAHRRESVLVADVATDPLWAAYKQLLLPHGLRACWSAPILSPDRQLLGTFAIYRAAPGLPGETEQHLINTAVHVAAICLNRNQLLRSLRSSELRFRRVFEQAADGVLIMSADGHFVDANPAALKMFGYTLEELRQRTPEQLTAPQDHVEIPPPQGEWNMGRQEVRKLRQVRRDGSSFNAEVLLRRLDEQHFLVFLQDVSQRRRDEVRIRQLNRVHAMLTAITHVMVRHQRRDEVFAAACRIAVEQGGFHSAWISMPDVELRRFSVQVAVGQSRDFLLSLNFPLEGPDSMDALSRVVHTGKAVVVNDLHSDSAPAHRREEALALGVRSAALLPLMLDNRAIAVFALNASEPGFFDTGEMELLEQLATDISFALELGRREEQRTLNEAALRDSEERFRQFADHIDQIIFIIDYQRDQVIYLNSAFERITGYSRTHFLGSARALLTTVHPEDRTRVEMHADLLNTTSGHAPTVEFRQICKDGSVRWMRRRGYAIRNAEGVVYRVAGEVEDVTQRRQLEEQIRQAQKMEAVGQLAGGIAHDFNNILSVIMGNAELARQDMPATHAVQRQISEVLKASLRARDLVQQILAFSRQQQTQRKTISLAPIVEETERFLRATLPAGITLSVSNDAHAPQVLADGTQVQQALINLCTNAWQALEGQQGRISIELRATRIVHPQGSLAVGDYALLVVTDTGRGMDQAVLSHIFEPFFTTKPAGGGTGLGLAVVHGIMQEHGGVVTVTSTPQMGSRFSLYFPATHLAALPHSPSPPSEELPADGRGERLLMVDDEEALVDINTRLFRRLGYRVHSFTDPAAALAAFIADPDGFDVLLTDLNMPIMSGLELAQAVKSVRQDMPVLLASGYVSDELRGRAQDVGIEHVVYKPNSAADMCRAVQRLLNEYRGERRTTN